MRRYLRLVILIYSTCCFSYSQTVFYTTSKTNVGPGVILKKIHAPHKPWIINVLQIDLNNQYLKMETVTASDRNYGNENTSSMVARKEAPGHHVVGAVNADFYASGGLPIGSQVLNGEILKTSTGWWSLAFDISNKPTINMTSFTGQLATPGNLYPIADVNSARSTDQVILYNKYFGSSTGTNEWGTEVRVASVNDWLVNETMICTVETVESGIGNMILTPNKSILSGHGAGSAFLSGLSIGDTIEIDLNLAPSIPMIKQLVGGNLKLTENGTYTGSTNTDRHPRTFAGFSADSTTLFLATVDGRQTGSIGMTYRDLSDFMVSIGAQHAVNLDGGGSTTMVVNNIIENSLYQVERAVSNALMVVSSAPIDTINSIQVRPDNFRIFMGAAEQLTVTGWDQYFNKMEIDMSNLTYTVDNQYGSVDSNGLFSSALQSNAGHILIGYEGMVDTAQFYIKMLQSISLSPDTLMTDNISGISFKPTVTDEDNIIQHVPLQDFSWEVLNPEVGYIDSSGTFFGLTEGMTAVVASLYGASDTAYAKVQVGYGCTILDSMDSENNWELSGLLYDESYTDLSSVDYYSTIGTAAIRLDYRFIRSDLGRSWNYISRDIPIYGLPDSILVDFKSNPGDHRVHMLVMVIADDDGELFQSSIVPRDTNFVSYSFPVNEFGAVNTNSDFNYPIRFKELQIRLGYTGVVGDTNSGTLYFDNLRIEYPNSLSLDKLDSYMPESFQLDQNWPNPFNGSTSFSYYLMTDSNVKFSIYNLSGQKLITLINTKQPAGSHQLQWNGNSGNGKSVASGTYFFQLKVDNRSKTRKMVFLK